LDNGLLNKENALIKVLDFKVVMKKHFSNVTVSVIASVINLFSLFWVVRLYSVEEVGKYSAVIGYATILGTVFLLGVPQIMTLKRETKLLDSIIEFSLACFFLLGVLSLLFLLVNFLFSSLTGKGYVIINDILMVCLGISVINIWTVYRSIAALKNRFWFQSKQNLYSSAVQICSQSTLGLVGPTYANLCFGFYAGKFFSIFSYLRKFKIFPSFKNSRIAFNLLKREFIGVVLPSISAQTISSIAGLAVAPILLLVTSSRNVGLFFIGFQIAGIFSSFLGSSLSAIFLGELHQRNQTGVSISRLVQQLVIALAGAVFVLYPIFLIALWNLGDVLLPLKWRETISLVEILAPWLATNFISSIVSATATISGKFSFIFRITIIESTLKLLAILLGVQMMNFKGGLFIYSLVGVLNSVVWIYSCLRFSGNSKSSARMLSFVVLLCALTLLAFGQLGSTIIEI
jgi:O-antigen/teichoic acid export membrane protein